MFCASHLQKQQKTLSAIHEKSLKGSNRQQNCDDLIVRLHTIYNMKHGLTLKESYQFFLKTISFLVQRSVWSPAYKAIECHALLINSERKETPPAIIIEERTGCWTIPPFPFVLCIQLPSVNKTRVKERCFAVHHQPGLRGQTVNLTPSLPGGKPLCLHTWPCMHMCTS